MKKGILLLTLHHATLLSVPEWDGDNITPKFELFLLDKNDIATATRNSWHASALDGVLREH
jgi:hypothetical protein